MTKYILSEINIYPVKSLSGISLEEAEVTDRGLKYDRRWMLVDENGLFITQRAYPQMSRIKVALENGILLFSHKQNIQSSISIHVENYGGGQSNVVVWNDTVKASYISKEADEWFCEMLKIKCRLVHMPDESKRFVDKKYASKNEIVNFTDGYPFLLIGESSFDDLNSRLKEKVPMNRFRPNFVFTGGHPFDEDKMKSFKLCGINFYPVKPCSRCVLTTVDQATGIKGTEPLLTLSTYRTQNNKVMFGQNLLNEGTGIVKTGSELEKIEWK